MPPLGIIILAAGNSTRLKSSLTKVLHPLCGKPMLDYVVDAAVALKPQKISVVVGMNHQQIKSQFGIRKNLIYAHQRERLGTAHATSIGLKSLGDFHGEVLILSGDVPRLKHETLKALLKMGEPNSLAFVTAVLPHPVGYGRILRDAQGKVSGIVEEKNATFEQRQINEINAGIYRVSSDFLKRSLKRIKKDPLKGEFYLTEIVRLALEEKISIHTLTATDAQQVLGANTRAELAYLNQLMNRELLAKHLSAGVGMQNPDSIVVDSQVTIGEDSFLGAQVQLLGSTKIGRGCVIDTGCILRDTKIGDEVKVKPYSILEEVVVKSHATIGPFARLRPGSCVEEEAHVGNFVELKKTRLGKGSKANHLSYLGDSIIGSDVNIGAGTITCNYDGENKFVTRIDAGAFIGSDTQLVAPVRVGANAYIGSGTTVTQNVPAGALALSRTPQKNLPNYSKQKKEKKGK